MAVNAAVTKAAPNYIPFTCQANNKSITFPNQGIPPGPYSLIKNQSLPVIFTLNSESCGNNHKPCTGV